MNGTRTLRSAPKGSLFGLNMLVLRSWSLRHLVIQPCYDNTKPLQRCLPALHHQGCTLLAVFAGERHDVFTFPLLRLPATLGLLDVAKNTQLVVSFTS